MSREECARWLSALDQFEALVDSRVLDAFRDNYPVPAKQPREYDCDVPRGLRELRNHLESQKWFPGLDSERKHVFGHFENSDPQRTGWIVVHRMGQELGHLLGELHISLSPSADRAQRALQRIKKLETLFLTCHKWWPRNASSAAAPSPASLRQGVADADESAAAAAPSIRVDATTKEHEESSAASALSRGQLAVAIATLSAAPLLLEPVSGRECAAAAASYRSVTAVSPAASAAAAAAVPAAVVSAGPPNFTKMLQLRHRTDPGAIHPFLSPVSDIDAPKYSSRVRKSMCVNWMSDKLVRGRKPEERKQSESALRKGVRPPSLAPSAFAAAAVAPVPAFSATAPAPVAAAAAPAAASPPRSSPAASSMANAFPTAVSARRSSVAARSGRLSASTDDAAAAAAGASLVCSSDGRFGNEAGAVAEAAAAAAAAATTGDETGRDEQRLQQTNQQLRDHNAQLIIAAADMRRRLTNSSAEAAGLMAQLVANGAKRAALQDQVVYNGARLAASEAERAALQVRLAAFEQLAAQLPVVKQEKLDAQADALGAGQQAAKAQAAKRKADAELEAVTKRQCSTEADLEASSERRIVIKHELLDAGEQRQAAEEQALHAQAAAAEARAAKQKTEDELQQVAERQRSTEADLAASAAESVRLGNELRTESERVRDLLDGRSCRLCEEQPACAVCLPCGHLVGCLSCAEDWQQRGGAEAVCPLCREPLEKVQEVFFG